MGSDNVKRLYDAFHEPFRRTLKQNRLSEIGLVHSSKDAHQKYSEEEAVGDAQQDGAAEPPGAVAKSRKVSVRKALDAAYAKYGTRLSASNSSEELKSPTGVEDKCKETL